MSGARQLRRSEKHEVALSQQAMSVWAKSGGKWGQPDAWLPLAVHLLDAAYVGRRLATEWVSESQRKLLTRHLPGADAEAAATALVSFLCGVHDIGKATPAFVSQVPGLAAGCRKAGLPGVSVEGTAARELPHGIAGQVALQRWLMRRGWKESEAQFLGSVVGGHHGIPPTEEHLWAAEGAGRAKHFGKEPWSGVRAELLDYIVQVTDWARWEHEIRCVPWDDAAAVLLSGVVIMADWISSNQQLFPLFDVHSGQPERLVTQRTLHEARGAEGWVLLGLPQSPNMGDDSGANVYELLEEQFGFVGAQARPIQRQAVASARELGSQGLLIIEDVMGSGKTEAGLMAAHILAQAAGSGGVLIALPTQATADAMFHRVHAWLRRVGRVGGTTLNLVHGRAELNREFQDLDDIAIRQFGPASFPDNSHVEDLDEDGGKGKGPDPAVRMPWMTAKKSLLADYAVCTIDQVLMAALRSRHLALRHLGLTRKVVVLDEVHALDAYMDEYLTCALKWLAASGVSVVALSATLTPSLRNRLAAAYSEGLKLSHGQNTRRDSATFCEEAQDVPIVHRRVQGRRGRRRHKQDFDVPRLDYPLLTTVDTTGSRSVAVSQAGSSPRMRGAPRRARGRATWPRIIPAYAGSTRLRR